MKTIYYCLFFSLIITGCQKELSPENFAAVLPTVVTNPATSVTISTAASGGIITDDGGAAITARGICWGTSPAPVVSGNHTTDGTGAGAFASNMTGLTATTTYYVRAYAINGAGIAYGNEISFTTTNTSTALPTVSTAGLSAISTTSLTTGGDVTNDGGAAITVRGVCWSNGANPTTALSTKTTDGSGTGVFVSVMTGLTAGTTYHVRAYATNSVGTSYGADSTFTTATTLSLPTITTTAVTSITSTTATSGGTISNDGGATVTVRGVCWSTAANPTTALPTKTTDGSGIGTFPSAITGLTANTNYHVRAYATNSVGTAYGNDVSFTTTSTTIPDVYAGGYEAGTVEFIAKTWKNGVSTVLTDGTKDARVNSVFISGTDFYAAGSEVDGVTSGDNQPKLWKNGTLLTALSSVCRGFCSSVFVSGTDVHVAGGTATTLIGGPCDGQVRAITWKNNLRTDITDGSKVAQANAVFVSGSDTYFAGKEMFPANGTFIAKLWKNGIVTALTDGSGHASANTVFVAGTDVYVGGEEERPAVAPFTAKIWKNGTGTFLAAGLYDSYVKSVFVSGGNVYAAGYQGTATPSKYVATLWVNGIATSLTNGLNDAKAYAVFVYGTDVYVAGYENNGTKDVAKIWKNGVATSLTDGSENAAAYSVFVK